MAVFPNARGFSFALFESPLAPVDWGAVELRGKDRNESCLRRLSQLLSRYQPDVVVLEDMKVSRRASRIQRLNVAMATLAETAGGQVVAYTRERVRACFANEGGATKQQVAEAIAKRIPMFERLVPPPVMAARCCTFGFNNAR